MMKVSEKGLNNWGFQNPSTEIVQTCWMITDVSIFVYFIYMQEVDFSNR